MNRTDGKVNESDKISAAIKLLAPFTCISLEVLFDPNKIKINHTRHEYRQHWKTTLAKWHLLVHSYLTMIRKLCSFNYRYSTNLTNTSTARTARKRLEKRQQCDIAIQSIDRPNLLRSLEFVDSTLLMVLNANNIGELVLKEQINVSM